MRLRTLFSLLLVFAFVWLVVSTVAMNQDRVGVRLTFLEPFEVELWAVILAAFAVGAGLILAFDLASGAQRMARERRARKAHRAHEKMEDLYLHGLDDMVNGRYEQAIAAFDQVLDHDPDHLNALIKRGDSLRSLSRHREAADSLERAIRLAPDKLVALYSLSDAYLELGDERRAEEILQRITRIDPETTVSAHRKLRELKMRQGDWERADELQQKIESIVTLAREKEVARAASLGIRFELGCDRLARGKIAEAIEAFESVLERDERFVPAYVKLGEARSAQDDSSKALEVWRKGYEATGSPELLAAVQNHYLRVDRPEEAIAVWKQALVLSDNEAPLRYCLGKLYYRLFMLDEALKELRLIEDTVSGLPALHVYIARILENKGDLQGALAKSKFVLGEVGGLTMDYGCTTCQKPFAEWHARCDRCGQWNSVSLAVRAAAVPEPTIRPAPTWSTP